MLNRFDTGAAVRLLLSFIVDIVLKVQHSEDMKKHLGASEMTQWLKVLATKPDDLSSIPEVHMV